MSGETIQSPFDVVGNLVGIATGVITSAPVILESLWGAGGMLSNTIQKGLDWGINGESLAPGTIYDQTTDRGQLELAIVNRGMFIGETDSSGRTPIYARNGKTLLGFMDRWGQISHQQLQVKLANPMAEVAKGGVGGVDVRSTNPAFDPTSEEAEDYRHLNEIVASFTAPKTYYVSDVGNLVGYASQQAMDAAVDFLYRQSDRSLTAQQFRATLSQYASGSNIPTSPALWQALLKTVSAIEVFNAVNPDNKTPSDAQIAAFGGAVNAWMKTNGYIDSRAAQQYLLNHKDSTNVVADLALRTFTVDTQDLAKVFPGVASVQMNAALQKIWIGTRSDQAFPEFVTKVQQVNGYGQPLNPTLRDAVKTQLNGPTISNNTQSIVPVSQAAQGGAPLPPPPPKVDLVKAFEIATAATAVAGVTSTAINAGKGWLYLQQLWAPGPDAAKPFEAGQPAESLVRELADNPTSFFKKYYDGKDGGEALLLGVVRQVNGTETIKMAVPDDLYRALLREQQAKTPGLKYGDPLVVSMPLLNGTLQANVNVLPPPYSLRKAGLLSDYRVEYVKSEQGNYTRVNLGPEDGQVEYEGRFFEKTEINSSMLRATFNVGNVILGKPITPGDFNAELMNVLEYSLARTNLLIETGGNPYIVYPVNGAHRSLVSGEKTTSNMYVNLANWGAIEKLSYKAEANAFANLIEPGARFEVRPGSNIPIRSLGPVSVDLPPTMGGWLESSFFGGKIGLNTRHISTKESPVSGAPFSMAVMGRLKINRVEVSSAPPPQPSPSPSPNALSLIGAPGVMSLKDQPSSKPQTESPSVGTLWDRTIAMADPKGLFVPIWVGNLQTNRQVLMRTNPQTGEITLSYNDGDLLATYPAGTEKAQIVKDMGTKEHPLFGQGEVLYPKNEGFVSSGWVGNPPTNRQLEYGTNSNGLVTVRDEKGETLATYKKYTSKDDIRSTMNNLASRLYNRGPKLVTTLSQEQPNNTVGNGTKMTIDLGPNGKGSVISFGEKKIVKLPNSSPEDAKKLLAMQPSPLFKNMSDVEKEAAYRLLDVNSQGVYPRQISQIPKLTGLTGPRLTV